MFTHSLQDIMLNKAERTKIPCLGQHRWFSPQCHRWMGKMDQESPQSILEKVGQAGPGRTGGKDRLFLLFPECGHHALKCKWSSRSIVASASSEPLLLSLGATAFVSRAHYGQFFLSHQVLAVYLRPNGFQDEQLHPKKGPED